MSIIVENKKLVQYVTDKDILVTEGRAISAEIEKVEKRIATLEAKEKAITAKVQPPKELSDRGEELMKTLQANIKELDEVSAQIRDIKLAGIPADMKKEHEDLMKKREELERDRNKVALKVQKIKDRVVPLIQKEVKPMLKEEFDDIETAKVKDGKLVISTFNHRKDWEVKFRQKTR